jgi:hypothetical protein
VGGFPSNVQATNASLGPVTGLALDSDGNFYIGAVNYGSVLRLDASSGTLSIAAGTGYVGSGNQPGPAGNAAFGGFRWSPCMAGKPDGFFPLWNPPSSLMGL